MEVSLFSEKNLIISVKEARKLIGAEANDLTDSEVLQIIQELTQLADIYISSLKGGDNEQSS